MSKPSLLRALRVPPDQQIGTLLVLITIEISIIVPVSQAIPFPYSIICIPLIIGLGILSLYFYVKKITHKELTYGITAQLSVFNDRITSSIRDRLTILYNGQPQWNLHIALLKIQNKGNTQIEKTDFHGKSMLITFPGDIELVDVAVKDQNSSYVTKDEAKRVNGGIILMPFSLAIHESFNLRFIFHFKDNEDLEKLRGIDLNEDDGQGSGFEFDMFKDDDWEEIMKRKTAMREKWFSALLSFISVLSVAFCVYIWFFSNTLHLLPLLYQLFLVVIITIFYFGLVVSMVFNRKAPPSTT